MNMEDLTARIEEMSPVSGADIRAVVYALFAVMKRGLSEGKIVRICELGSLQIGISSKGGETEEAVSENSNKSSKVALIQGSPDKGNA